MADTASTLNFGPQWLHKQFSVPEANGGGGGHGGGGGGTGPAGFHVGRGGDHRGGGGKVLVIGYVIIGAMRKMSRSRNHREPAGPHGNDVRYQTPDFHAFESNAEMSRIVIVSARVAFNIWSRNIDLYWWYRLR